MVHAKIRTLKNILLVSIIFILLTSCFSIVVPGAWNKKPDLTISNVEYNSSVIEGNIVEVKVEITNIGDKKIPGGSPPFGLPIYVGMYIDDQFVVNNYTMNGLDIGSSCNINLYWESTLGDSVQRNLNITVDYMDIIWEKNESNNDFSDVINVEMKDPFLEIIDVDISGDFKVGKLGHIYMDIINMGKTANGTITGKLYSDKEGLIQTLDTIEVLEKNDVYTFMFNWTPTIYGSHVLTFGVFYNGSLEDFGNISVNVKTSKYNWWDSNWHYRYMLKTRGVGNVSLTVNFTRIQSSIGVLAPFENNTIRIVEYNSDGSIINNGVVDIYFFKEKNNYDKNKNAVGDLIWNITGDNSIDRFFCIYFDVENNPGKRDVLEEDENITTSGDVTYVSNVFFDGWWPEITTPSSDLIIFGYPYTLTVEAKSQAYNISALAYWNDNSSYNHLYYLDAIDENITWEIEDIVLDKQGNWTIIVAGQDLAGYTTYLIEKQFMVKKTDLTVYNITHRTEYTATSPDIYLDDTVTFSANLTGSMISISDVTVNLSIYDSTDNITFNNVKTTTVERDVENIVSFNKWEPDETGTYKISVEVDPDDVFDELNESNNIFEKTVDVLLWPDLVVDDIIIPSEKYEEGDDIQIEVVVENLNDIKADNYVVGLYKDKEKDDDFDFDSIIVDKKISIGKKTSKTFTFTWEDAEPGNWYIGVKINTTNSKRDMDTSNNKLVGNKTLIVKSIEKNKPIIKNLNIDPDEQEKGEPVYIYADVTDDTGLSSVKIKITTPKNKIIEGVMKRESNDTFIYKFEETQDIGKYSFMITAVDISIHENKATISSKFTVAKDLTPPVISYYNVDPNPQLKDKDISFECTVDDNQNIDLVQLVVTDPNSNKQTFTMEKETDGIYQHIKSFTIIGEYTFYIKAEDDSGNLAETDEDNFWVTSNVNDRDNDGIPDWWEEQYDLNPDNPDDADMDEDNDGLTNLDEYKMGTNPAKDIFSENAAARIKSNIIYLVGAIVIFIAIIVLAVYGLKRR